MNNQSIIRVNNLTKYYVQGKEKLVILEDANLEIRKNETVALIGESGSGKTTLLQILGLLDDEYSGSVIINNKDYSKSNEIERTSCRRKNIGFIYQSHNLLSEFTAVENIALPLLLNNTSKLESKKKALSLMQELGLDERKRHLPSQLSGGQQQRVAIARSLAHSPLLVLADEPTGNLDPQNAHIVFDLFVSFVKKHQTSALVVTHNIELAKKLDRTITIKNGKIVEI